MKESTRRVPGLCTSVVCSSLTPLWYNRFHSSYLVFPLWTVCVTLAGSCSGSMTQITRLNCLRPGKPLARRCCSCSSGTAASSFFFLSFLKFNRLIYFTSQPQLLLPPLLHSLLPSPLHHPSSPLLCFCYERGRPPMGISKAWHMELQ